MKQRFQFKKKFNWSDILFGAFIVLLIIPQTRRSIQVGINQLKVLVWSPSIENDKATVNVPAFDYTVRDLDNEEVIKRIGNGQITFLSFWATWCAPCVAELPSIDALFQDYKNQVDFVLVTRENPKEVRRFLEKKDIYLPVYFPISEVPNELKSNSLPTNYLIDAKGKVIVSEKGAANWNSKKVRVLLDDLLKE